MDDLKSFLVDDNRSLALRAALVTSALWIGYSIVVAAYNVSPLHPLYRFPGPKLAAMSWLYEFYFDVVHQGTYSREIKRLHSIYGPIIRINPSELHCNDPQFTDEIYAAGGRKRNRFYFTLASFPSPLDVSAMAALDHDHHRHRRDAMQKFFSRGNIAKMDRDIHAMAQHLCDKMLATAGSGEAFELTAAYSCYASDVIATSCFGEPFGLLAQDGFEPNFRKASFAFARTYFIFRFFPFLKYSTVLAPFLGKFLPRDLANLNDTTQVVIPGHINKAKEDYEAKVIKSRDTVFDSILQSSLPPAEKTVVRLTGEATVLMSAGTETTSWALAVISFYILNNPDLLKRLTEELMAVAPDARNLPSWYALERLPLLSATLLEGLRLSYGVSIRSARVPRDEDLIYHGTWVPPKAKEPVAVSHVIARGTPIGMTSWITHHDESIFPDSHTFKPERFLDENLHRRRDVEKNFLGFSKGSRNCLGMNLAYCELYLALAALILRVFPRMEMYETDIDSVAYDYDLFVAMPKSAARGIRAIVV